MAKQIGNFWRHSTAKNHTGRYNQQLDELQANIWNYQEIGHQKMVKVSKKELLVLSNRNHQPQKRKA